jgi:hypothetical protein
VAQALLPVQVSVHSQEWLCHLRHTRQISDFRAWKDHDAFQKSFNRLLRDLDA